MTKQAEYYDASFDDIDNVVRSVARKVAREYELNYDEHSDDLVQAGWAGALHARNRYKPQGYKFITYAYHFINGDIRRAAKWLVKGNSNVDMDALLELDSGTDLTFDIWINDLLSTADGLELLAAELSTPTNQLKDNSKRGAAIRREQVEKLRKKWKLADAT